MNHCFARRGKEKSRYQNLSSAKLSYSLIWGFSWKANLGACSGRER